MKKCKILAGLAAVCIAAASLSVVATAVEPSYEVSADYKDTLYYNNLSALELTGDGATDVIAVALSQLGYHEGNKDSDKDGLNSSGSKNFVEYNVLFGKLDNGEGNGYSYGYAWCAAFVNWCLRQARVDKELTGGMYVSCNSWRNWFINEGAKYGASYHARTDDYIPKKGDLIFYKSLSAIHSRATDHIGIVLKSENGKVYAIEGNGDNRVALHEYALTDRYIVGYGSIAYKTADVPEVDYYRTEDHLPGYFIAGGGVISAYQGPATSTGKVTNLTAHGVYRITAVQGRYGCVVLEDGTSAWVSLKRFTPITTDPYHTVELHNGDKTYSIRVAVGTSFAIPDEKLLTDALGEMTEFYGWRAEDGSLLSAGAVLSPEADVKLQAVTEDPTQTETEAETNTVTESQATESVPESSVKEESAPELSAGEQSTDQASEGCSGTISIGALMLSAGAALALKKKKTE
ncbi:MAG: CHAP domain-containing protein [Clostridia bacterium]|nr:CHAP domain-containing protein [Clostridia bacterium]